MPLMRIFNFSVGHKVVITFHYAKPAWTSTVISPGVLAPEDVTRYVKESLVCEGFWPCSNLMMG
jgi:hypothetical protein